jgi:monofunctional biosynthetic peptidoglycan transglycosylase
MMRHNRTTGPGRAIAVALALGLGLSTNAPAAPDGDAEREREPGARVLFDFNAPDASSRWRSVNDGVMGGVSEGAFRIDDSGVMRFSGTLSLENNGGFASVRTVPQDLGLASIDEVLVLRLRGDGRPYLLNLYTPSRRTAFSYRAEFPTAEGEWIEARIPIRACRASSFGRPAPGDDPVDPTRVNALGITLSDKNPGPFLLEIQSIRVVRGDGSTAVTTSPADQADAR